MRLLMTLLTATLLAGCGFVYKIDVQQGNYVTQDAVARVKKGMTKAEVRQVLGTPLLADIFHAQRWDYYFSQVKGGKPQDRTLLSVYFENDKVVEVKGDARPAALPPVGPGMPPPATSPAGPAAPEPAGK